MFDLRKSSVARLLLAICLIGFSQVSLAGTAEDTLINKLNTIYQNLAPSNPTRISIAQRLADLYSERARSKFKQELESGCSNDCNAGVADRKKALGLYKSILNKVDSAKKGKILVQMGHLNELMGKSNEAERIYSQISKGGSGEQRIEAEMSKAELLFKRGEFARAIPGYRKVMSDAGAKNRGLASYRLAWCEFNVGNTQAAKKTLMSLLKDPQRLQRTSHGGAAVVDPEFQQQAAKDLATFMGRTGASLSDAKMLAKLSGQKQKLPNLSYLASELERMGKDKDSIAVYVYVAEQQSDVLERLKSYAVLSDLLMKKKDYKKSLDYYGQALGSWELAKTKCEPSECKEIHLRMKNYLVSWNQVEKKKPSDHLLMAYQKYLEVFSQETKVVTWYVAALKTRGQWDLAMSQQDQLINTYSQGAQANKVKLEQALLLQIELAELSKDSAKHSKYLDLYTKKSGQKTQLARVEYQKAKLAYDNKQYQKAANDFYAIAKSPQGKDRGLKIKAANLALDSLVLLKDDTRLEIWASDLAQKFPSEKASFSKMALRSVLTQTQKKSQSPEQLNEAWATLSRAQIQGATEADKITYYKNKIALAELLGKFTEARVAVNDLLRVKGLSSSDKQYALTKQAWFAELNLDFSSALVALNKLGAPKKKADQASYQLKLAILAELAKKPSEQYYKKYLKLASGEEARAIIAKLLKSSTSLKRDISKYQRWLKTKPEALSYWQFVAYSQKPDLKYAKSVVRKTRNKKTAGIRLLQRELLLDELTKYQSVLSKHQLRTKNQNHLARDLKKRIQLIAKAEKLAEKAIQSEDWVAQLVALSMVRNANDRIQKELLAIPVPAELTPEQRQQFSDAIAAQAGQYRSKNEELNVKINEFLTSPGREQVFTETKDQPKSVQSVIIAELQKVDALNPQANVVADIQAKYAANVQASVANISPQEVESVKKLVRQKPLAIDPLNQLISFEERRNPNSEIFNYLVARRNKIKALGVKQ